MTVTTEHDGDDVQDWPHHASEEFAPAYIGREMGYETKEVGGAESSD